MSDIMSCVATVAIRTIAAASALLRRMPRARVDLARFMVVALLVSSWVRSALESLRPQGPLVLSRGQPAAGDYVRLPAALGM
jgi:hypothetical protein